MNFAGQTTIPAQFSTGTYMVTRRGPATVSPDGRRHDAPASTFTILASVQPLTGKDLERLPEGMRIAERRKIYTTTPLQVSRAPDVVSIGGRSYECETIEDWVGYGSDYYRVIAARVGD